MTVRVDGRRSTVDSAPRRSPNGRRRRVTHPLFVSSGYPLASSEGVAVGGWWSLLLTVCLHSLGLCAFNMGESADGRQNGVGEMTDIIGYEHVAEVGWQPVGSGVTWCDRCGVVHGDDWDCNPWPCDDPDCTGCELTNQRWADCGANYPDGDTYRAFTAVSR